MHPYIYMVKWLSHIIILLAHFKQKQQQYCYRLGVYQIITNTIYELNFKNYQYMLRIYL